MGQKQIAVHSVEQDPRSNADDLRPKPVGELVSFQLGGRKEQITHIGAQLEPRIEEEIKKVVLKNDDLFAWSVADMPGIDPEFICHKLSLWPDAKPVAQRKRNIREERREVIEKEMTKLMEANFVHEIKYTTWLSNVVLVKKSNGK